MKSYYKSMFIIALIMIVFTSCKDETNPTEDQHEHFEAVGIVLYQNGQMVFRVNEGIIDKSIADSLRIPLGIATDFTIKFILEDGDEVIMPDDEDKELSWSIGDASILGITKYSDDRSKLTITGLKTGMLGIEIHILHNGHIDFRTPEIPVIVE
jgi:hypothetical protein